MAALDSFLPHFRGNLPGCPDFVMRDAVREAAIRFCRETSLFVEWVDVTTVIDQRFYVLSPTGGESWGIEDLRREDLPLYASSRKEFREERHDRTSGQASSYYLEGDKRLVLGPIPDAVETLVAELTLAPASDATTIQDALYDDWRTAIVAGAELHVRETVEAFGDPEREVKLLYLFEGGISMAQMRLAKGGTRRRLRTKGQYF